MARICVCKYRQNYWRSRAARITFCCDCRNCGIPGCFATFVVDNDKIVASLGCQPPLLGVPKARTPPLARIISKIEAFVGWKFPFQAKTIKIVVLLGDENHVLLKSSMPWRSSVAHATVFPQHHIQMSRVVEIAAFLVLPFISPFLVGNFEECHAASACHEGERAMVHGGGTGRGARRCGARSLDGGALPPFAARWWPCG